MSRALRSVPAIVALIVAATMVPGSLRAAEGSCVTEPAPPAPAGQRWNYRTDRSTGQRCWYLRSAQVAAAPRPASRMADAQPLAPAVAEARAEWLPPAREDVTGTTSEPARAAVAEPVFVVPEQPQTESQPMVAVPTPIDDAVSADSTIGLRNILLPSLGLLAAFEIAASAMFPLWRLRRRDDVLTTRPHWRSVPLIEAETTARAPQSAELVDSLLQIERLLGEFVVTDRAKADGDLARATA